MNGTRPTYKVEPVEQRFMRQVEVSDGCWTWLGAIGANGYGSFGIRQANVLAHRHSYEMHKGPIPKGLQIDHLCRNRACVNPDHLEAVTQAENVRRAGKWINKLGTTCKWGHEMSEANTRRMSSGRSECLQCYIDRNKRPRMSQKDRYSNGNS